MAMPKPPASFTVFLCLLLLFTSSSARAPLEDIDDTNHDLFSGSDKNPDTANTILLPSSDKGESQPATLIHWESQTADSKISTQPSDPVPFTLMSFRPINRPRPSSLRLRHRCPHNHRFKPLNQRLPLREIPYAVEDNPGRWMRFLHVEPRLFHDPSMERSEEMRSPLLHPAEDKGLMKRIRKFLNHF